MIDDLTISVALVTRNRPESLRRCLKSWRSQSLQPFEIIVSDDSDDEFRDDVKKIAEEFDARWLAGPRRGLYANRNLAAGHCSGSHIISSDDDHEHPSDMLETCRAAVVADPDSAYCLGEVAAWEDIAGDWYLPGELSLNGGSTVPADLDNCQAWSDGATIFPRKIVDDGLTFCEDFRFGGSYLEFGALLKAAGWRIRVLSTTGVIHHFAGVDRSFELPVEELASWYFAKLMLARTYEPTLLNSVLLLLYFSKQVVLNPISFSKAFPWARRSARARSLWFRSRNDTRRKVKPQ